MNIKEVWSVWRESVQSDKDMQRAFERACTPQECHKLLIEIETLKAQLENIKSIALNPTVIDFVRCGIGGNYGGKYYDDMIDKIHTPMVYLAAQLSNKTTNCGKPPTKENNHE